MFKKLDSLLVLHHRIMAMLVYYCVVIHHLGVEPKVWCRWAFVLAAVVPTILLAAYGGVAGGLFAFGWVIAVLGTRVIYATCIYRMNERYTRDKEGFLKWIEELKAEGGKDAT